MENIYMPEFEGRIDLEVDKVSVRVFYDLSTEQPVTRKVNCSCKRKAVITDLVQIRAAYSGSIRIDNLGFGKIVIRAVKRQLKHRTPWCRRCYHSRYEKTPEDLLGD
jgi:hypothetical protein